MNRKGRDRVSASKKEKKQHQEEAATEEQEQLEAQQQPEEPAPKSPEELLKEENAALNDRLLRLLAEYDNYRKRSQKEKEAIYPNAVAETAKLLLPIIDNFERAAQFECTDEEFKKGFDLIKASFDEVLKKLSIECFGAEGEPFNPELHNCVMHIEDEEKEENVIAQVMQKGYKIGDRILRHAMVSVAN